MARALEFRIDGQSWKAGIEKVDRTALYGTVDVETRDKSGARCDVATLAADGRTLIPTGGTALGYISPKGRWLERSELVAVDVRGTRVNTVSSSFEAPIDLETKTTVERFLDHSIRAAYLLDMTEAVPSKLQAAFDAGTIFKFDFSYRGGSNSDPAFLMKGADDALWMLVGDDNNINFVGLAQVAAPIADEPAADSDGDDLSFDMM
jgi:hypothetical protein